MNEAYGAAARHAASYARVLVGKAAGASLGLGVAGALGSTIMYATALPPYADEMKLKGFNEATDNLYVSAAPALALAKTAPAKAAPAPALAPSPPSAQPRYHSGNSSLLLGESRVPQLSMSRQGV